MFPSSYSFLADSHGFQLQHIATYGYFVSPASIDPPPQNINLTVTASTLAHSRHRVTNIRPEIQSLMYSAPTFKSLCPSQCHHPHMGGYPQAHQEAQKRRCPSCS